MSTSDEPACRICLETGTRSDFIAPCACAGSSKWVHRSCLDRWRSVREDKAFSRCTECLQSYKLICVTNDTPHDRWMRRIKFGCLLTRDFGLVLLASQAVVGLLGGLVYLLDGNKRTLISIFHMNRHMFLFYYLFGLLLTLSLIGMIFSCMPRQDNAVDVMCCSGCDGGCHGVYCYPYPPVAATDSTTCCCCNCGDCLGAGGAPMCECGSCECCSGAALGEEAFVCVIGVLVIFAIIGVFYCIAMGAYYVQYVTQKHYHVVEKLNLTQEYRVADLAEGALAIDYVPPAYEDLESGPLTSPHLGSSGGGIEMGWTRGGSTGRTDYQPVSLGGDSSHGQEDSMIQESSEAVSSSSGGGVSVVNPMLAASSGVDVASPAPEVRQTLLSVRQVNELLSMGLL